MLFLDVLKKHEMAIRPAFDALVKDTLQKQRHPGEMLIWANNGFYEESILSFQQNRGLTLNPYVIGPGEAGHSESTHYNFIYQYRQAYLSKMRHSEYLELHEFSAQRSTDIDELLKFEEITINLEMLVYLKFWESDSIIKKLYEIVRINHSEPYDWHFKIRESNRDTTATGKREYLIRNKIRDRIQHSYPNLYHAIKSAYKTQIRNAIAHSKYFFLGRNIHLNNFIDGDKNSQLKTISYDDWVNIFHITIVLHNEYIRATNTVHEHYARIAEASHYVLPILIPGVNGAEFQAYLTYNPDQKRWYYQ